MSTQKPKMAKKQTSRPTGQPHPTERAPSAKGKGKTKADGGSFIVGMAGTIQYLLNQFTENEHIDSTLTGKERMRLIGAGVKNYGLIDKAYDIARDNPQFMPPFLTPQDMWNDMHDFEEIRQLVMVLEKFLQLATECMMIKGDKCFRDALRVYDSLKEMAKNKVPGAQPLYESLMTFFRRRRRPGEVEPTMKELERDFSSLLHGHADGKIVIENEKPQTSKGIRKVVDDIHRGRSIIKETAETEIDEK